MTTIVTMTIEFEEYADYQQFRDVIDQDTNYVSLVVDGYKEEDD